MTRNDEFLTHGHGLSEHRFDLLPTAVDQYNKKRSSETQYLKITNKKT